MIYSTYIYMYMNFCSVLNSSGDNRCRCATIFIRFKPSTQHFELELFLWPTTKKLVQYHDNVMILFFRWIQCHCIHQGHWQGVTTEYMYWYPLYTRSTLYFTYRYPYTVHIRAVMHAPAVQHRIPIRHNKRPCALHTCGRLSFEKLRPVMSQSYNITCVSPMIFYLRLSTSPCLRM